MVTICQFPMTIDGQSVDSGTALEVINPATESLIGVASDCTRALLDRAVSSAREAYPKWKALPLSERQAMVASIGRILREHTDELKMLVTAEQGKPLSAAEGDVLAGAIWCEAMSTFSLPIVVSEDTEARICETRNVPLGVVGAIAPWNVPIGLAMWKVAPALVAGNTVVLKPSPFTPLATLRLGELLQGVLPRGVLNVISGGDGLGPWMTEHPGFDKISFTGSTQTGRKVMQSAAATLKRVTLELGGNDAAIVLPDVDVKVVAQELFHNALSNSGQICIATKRIYVHEDIYLEFVAEMVRLARNAKVGNGAEAGTEFGPIQNRRQYERVLDLLEDCRTNKYEFLVGGESRNDVGFFVPITFVDNPPDAARIVVEEQFGPVVPILKFSDIDDVILRVNNSQYGLGGSVWSGDLAKAMEIGKLLEVGTVWVNHSMYLTPYMAFGGHKQSGIGVENGIDGLLEYTNKQTTVMRKAGFAP